MSYNIDSIDIVSGELQITPLALLRFAREVEADPDGYLPEGMSDALHVAVDGGRDRGFMDGCKIVRIPWYGEGSGNTELRLRDFLGRCDGTAALLLCWEGGDSYTGLIVSDGEVTDGDVVQTVVPKP